MPDKSSLPLHARVHDKVTGGELEAAADELLALGDMPSKQASAMAHGYLKNINGGFGDKLGIEYRHEHSRVRASSNGGFNLRGVVEVLEEAGLDPTAEIAKVLAIQGEGALSPEMRAKINLELLQYVHPKLKAVEHSGKVEVDDSQIDKRLEQLLGKAHGRGRR